MPLDKVGRTYADALLQEQLERIQKEYRGKLADVRHNFISRNLVHSGMNAQAHAQVLVWHVDRMGEARTDSLLQAYERSGLPFDDAALKEISAEVTDFCWGQQHNAVSAMNTMLVQFSLPNNEGVSASLTQQIEHGVSATISRLQRRLRIKRSEVMLNENRQKARATTPGNWDAFISHASEDKDFVRPLAQALQEAGLSVWLDELTLEVGDSLRKKIDEGLSQSRFGIVVVSKNFFAKDWPQAELDGLVAREIGGAKVILPIWYKISESEVKARSPMLAARFAALSEEGMDAIVTKLRRAMGLPS